MRNATSILVTGASGQLGQSFQKIAPNYPHYQFHFASRNDLDLSKIGRVPDYFKQNRFDFIINCAAYTAVDKAEQEAELANIVNHLAVKKLAEIAKLHDSTLIHVSTDYVFEGTNYTPYVETDLTHPQSVYGISKLKGEQAMQAVEPNGAIIRTSWVYSEFGNNFVKTMLKLGVERDQLNVIYDQVGSPTYAKDLAQTIMKIIVADILKDHSKVPVYHYGNEGVCSWYDFAKAIFEMSNIHCDVYPIETKDYPTPAKRPHYSVLNKEKIKHDYDLTIPYWKDSLKACLLVLQENKT